MTNHSRLLVVASLLVGAALIAVPSRSFGLDSLFMKDSAYRDFGDDDLAKVDKAVKDALTSVTENSSVSWKNEVTGNSGEVIALTSFLHDSQTCRSIKVINRSKRRLGRGVYNLCQEKSGNWEVAKTNTQEAHD